MLGRLHGCGFSVSSRRYSLTTVRLSLTVFLAPRSQYLSLRYGSCLVDVSGVTELHNSVLWLVVVFCNGVVAKEGFLDKECGLYSSVGIKNI